MNTRGMYISLLRRRMERVTGTIQRLLLPGTWAGLYKQKDWIYTVVWR